MGFSSSYCGLFFKIPDCKNEIKVRRRFFTDKMSFEKRHKTGNHEIDRKVTIFASNKENIPIHISSEIIRTFLEMNKTIMPMELVTIHNSLSGVPLLHGKNWLALVINRSWLLDSKKLKLLVKGGSEIFRKASTSFVHN